MASDVTRTAAGTSLVLFDGDAATFASWNTTGGGDFRLVNGLIVTEPGGDLGLCYYAGRRFDDFILRIEFRLERGDENSGVWVRFRDPRRLVPDRGDPTRLHAYDNPSFVAVDTGFEIQIDEIARGNSLTGTPDGAAEHRTGAIYDVPCGAAPGEQQRTPGPRLEPGAWNQYVVEVRGDAYRVILNGRQTTMFINTDPFRGRAASRDPESGYIGLQSHSGHVAFRNITIVTVDTLGV
jgi:hypothetical protein